MKTKLLLLTALISFSIIVAAGIVVYVATNTAAPTVDHKDNEQNSKQSYYSLPSFIPMAKVGY